MTQNFVNTSRRERMAFLVACGLAGAGLVWAHWTSLSELARRWGSDPQYSHGYLVPGFALVLLWLRRGLLVNADCRPSWWGLPLLGLGVAARLGATYFHYAWGESVSFLPCLAGVLVLAGGWRALHWAWPALAFLFYMIPLPYRLATALSGPLQRLATIASTFALQTLGLPALAEGNVIMLNEVEIGIVEACSGLRMLVIFFALCTAVALLSRRPLWERLLMVASAVPIALVSNLLRIIVTGVLHETAGSEIANAVFHDLAGWLMMPLALVFLWVELQMLSHLLVEPAHLAAAIPGTGRQRSTPVPPPPRPSRAARRAQSATPRGRPATGLP